MKEIISLQHPLVKHLVKLREDRGFRYQEGHVLLSGRKILLELPPSNLLRTVLIRKGDSYNLPFLAERVFAVDESILKKVTGLSSTDGVVAEVAMAPTPDLSHAEYLLILDGVGDPGNLGTLFRSALGLGWDGVFLLPGGVDPYNEKAIRSARGATFRLPWKNGSKEELKALLQERNFFLFGAESKGISCQQVSPVSLPIALILGNEGHGIQSQDLRQINWVSVPMEGQMESLNVATAGAILMFFLKSNILKG